MVSIHEIAARNLRQGDRLAEDGAAGLEHAYHTDVAGQDVTVHAVERDGELVVVDFGSASIVTRPDIRVAVIRER